MRMGMILGEACIVPRQLHALVESSVLDCFQRQSSNLDSTKQQAIKNAGSFASGVLATKR
ncbi:hypothetical protein VM57_08385 [Stenotrophomonas maltophilia]|uniref:Uncharacterized protein n=1 Tax=Stenotrophomonas maltophilia TaxID=40324 RepID=A0A0F5ZQV5_STEMA|nr:hypothetical protein VM57_08385 [Stenotrophomonas maltophilia]